MLHDPSFLPGHRKASGKTQLPQPLELHTQKLVHKRSPSLSHWHVIDADCGGLKLRAARDLSQQVGEVFPIPFTGHLTADNSRNRFAAYQLELSESRLFLGEVQADGHRPGSAQQGYGG